MAKTKKKDSPLCSIVIPLFNRLFFTKLCLDYLKKYTEKDLPQEIILVNNGSSDGTQEFLLPLEREYKVLSNPSNLGFAKACNQGARHARGEYLIFLNNDVIPQGGWLKEMLRALKRNPDTAIVGSKLLFPNGSIQHAGVVIGESKRVRHIYYTFDANHPAVCKEREFQAVTGACMMVRKKVFEDLGGLDEGYLNSFEDLDFCLRARMKGWKVIYCPASVLYHFESVTEGRFDNNIRNFQRFLEIWGDSLICDEKKYYLEDGIEDISWPDFTKMSEGSLQEMLKEISQLARKYADQASDYYQQLVASQNQVQEISQLAKGYADQASNYYQQLVASQNQASDYYQQLVASQNQASDYYQQLVASQNQVQEMSQLAKGYADQAMDYYQQLTTSQNQVQEISQLAKGYADQASNYYQQLVTSQNQVQELSNHLKATQERVEELEVILGRYNNFLTKAKFFFPPLKLVLKIYKAYKRKW